jgi:hypothetical protein
LFTYHMCGLGIHSELALPGLADGNALQDVLVRFGELDPLLAPPDANGYSFQTVADGVHFGWEGGARFWIRAGREITIAPDPGVEEGLVRALLLGPALAVVLHQRGFLILHGSAIALHERAVAFLGPVEAGKSTTAAAMHERGHAVVTDDVVAIQISSGQPHVFPAYPQLNLWPNAVASLGRDLAALPRLHSRVEKLALPAISGFSRNPLPLDLLYVLSKGSRTEVQILQPQEGFVGLLRHSYGTRLFLGGAATEHFQQCASLVKAVPVRRLRMRQRLTELSSLARLVEEDATHNSASRS